MEMNVTQTTPLRIRLSPEAREKVRIAAEMDHRSMTSWIEKLILDKCNEIAPPANVPKIGAAGEYEGV